MQLHCSRIISSFHYILQLIGQTSKAFRTWICINSGQLEDFSKIQINLLEKLVQFPRPSWNLYISPLSEYFFSFSWFLYILILNCYQDFRIFFGMFQRQPTYRWHLPLQVWEQSFGLAFYIKHGGFYVMAFSPEL